MDFTSAIATVLCPMSMLLFFFCLFSIFWDIISPFFSSPNYCSVLSGLLLPFRAHPGLQRSGQKDGTAADVPIQREDLAVLAARRRTTPPPPSSSL